MTSVETLITVASWEDRFYMGLEEHMERSDPSNILMFHFKKYADWSRENRDRAARLCKQRGINLVSEEITFSEPEETWRKVTSACAENVIDTDIATVDISTMPRETIWTILHLLSRQEKKVQYIYHKPKEYAQDWLSRDPGKPRFVYKLAGISSFGRPTTLVVLTGFDVERTKQLIYYFEPNQIVLGLQAGKQNENETKNRDAHKSELGEHNPISWFDLDGFSADSALESLRQSVDALVDTSNVILASLGPKIGALALYKYHMEHPSTSLVYAPSNEFNREYSSGFTGTIMEYL